MLTMVPERCCRVKCSVFLFIHGIQLGPEPHKLLDNRQVAILRSEVQCGPEGQGKDRDATS